MGHPGRIVGVAATAAVLVALVVLYAVDFLAEAPAAVSAVRHGATAQLTLQTVPSYGHAPDPDWVTYLARDANGHWHHSTAFKVPAHTLVTVTIYQFDSATGLRNPFFAQVRGTQGNVMTLDGKTMGIVNPDDASHTFTVPDLGVSVPLSGIPDNAKNPCSTAPCPLADDHTTITFTFDSGAPGTHRWQCFVPCAAKLIFGNGGPMQTFGWMSGVIQVT